LHDTLDEERTPYFQSVLRQQEKIEKKVGLDEKQEKLMHILYVDLTNKSLEVPLGLSLRGTSNTIG